MAQRFVGWLAQLPYYLQVITLRYHLYFFISIHDVTFGSGPFTVTAENTLGVTISFSGNCRQTAPGSQVATGNIAAGQFLTCNINTG